MTFDSNRDASFSVDEQVLPGRHVGHCSADASLAARLNDVAHRQAGAVAGVLEYWLAPGGESLFDVKS
jgi:hypothetical protein